MRPRSLRSLARTLASAGSRVSIATLKRWSSTYDWGRRTAEFDRDAAAHVRDDALQGEIELRERHASLGRAAAGAAAKSLQHLLANDRRLTGMSAGDIARLLDLGLRVERDAVAVETDRVDVALGVWDGAIREIVELFIRINAMPTPEERARRFGAGLDALAERHLAEIATSGGAR